MSIESEGVRGCRPRRGRRAAPLACFVAALLAPAAALADENSDLNLIPPSLAAPTPPPPEQATPPAASGNPRVYIQNDITGSPQRTDLPVPVPGPQQTWQERVFLDMRGSAALTDTLQAVYSFRLNAEAENDIQNPGPHTMLLESREAYLAWQPVPGAYVDAGRINVKNGVASGYNPTDFFAARSVVDPNTADPQVLREDRLGAVMIEGQYLWAGGSAVLLYSPKLSDPAPLRTTAQLPALGPFFDQTNTTGRWLAKITANVADDLAPELLLYHAGPETRIGGNLAQSVGRAVVLYGEWSGGWEPGLAAQAVEFGDATGMLSPQAAAASPFGEHRTFHSDLAIGGSYTTENKVSFILEYELHQAGLTTGQLRGFYDAAAGGNALAGQAMWLVRGYAADQEQPLGQQQVFARVSWNDAFVRDLELDAFAFVSLQDGSAMTQLSGTYDLSDHWEIGALATGTFGSPRSIYGGQTPAASLIAKISRFF